MKKTEFNAVLIKGETSDKDRLYCEKAGHPMLWPCPPNNRANDVSELLRRALITLAQQADH